MDHKIYETIAQYHMLQQGEGVVVGISGGADSVALLDFLCCLRDTRRNDLHVCACHLNHNLRGSESDRDEAFVREICKRLEVKLVVFSDDVAAFARASRQSVEAAARERRYARFAQTAAQEGGCRIATAHTLSDSMETALLNFARGTAVRGLCGIPAVRGNIIRPLIHCTRREVEEYCRRRALTYVTDSTNLEDVYTRNRIRRTVVPGLVTVNPDAETAFLRLSSVLRDTQDYLEEEAQQLLRAACVAEGREYDVRLLVRQHRAVRRVSLALLLGELGAQVSYLQVEKLDDALLAHSAAETDQAGSFFAAGRRWRIENNRLYFDMLTSARPVPRCVASPVRIENGTLAQFDDTNIHFLYDAYKHYKENENSDQIHLKNVADYDKIKGNAFVRGRAQGDSFSLPGRNWTKSLKKLFNEFAVPAEKRGRLAVCADEEGVFWVQGFGVHARVAVSGETKRVLLIQVIGEDATYCR